MFSIFAAAPALLVPCVIAGEDVAPSAAKEA